MSDGEGNLGWRAGLPADLQGNETFSQFKTVGDFAKHHLEVADTNNKSGEKIKDLEGKLGKAVFVPENNATEEDRAKFFKAIGRPDKAEDYAFDKIEGLEGQEQLEAWFRGVAFQHGLTKAQAAALHKDYAGAYAEAMKQAEAKRVQAIQDGVASLKKEWGDKATENEALVKKATDWIEKTIPGFKMQMDKTGYGNDTMLCKAFLEIGKAMADDKFVPGKPPGGGPKQKADGTLSYPSMQE